jgi:hypothetical protein
VALPNDPNTHTTRQLVDLVFQPAGQLGTRQRQVKPLLIRVAALTNRTLRGLLEMQYQFAEPFVVDSSKIGNILGVRATPVEKALANTSRPTAPSRPSDPKSATMRPASYAKCSGGAPKPAQRSYEYDACPNGCGVWLPYWLPDRTCALRVGSVVSMSDRLV